MDKTSVEEIEADRLILDSTLHRNKIMRCLVNLCMSLDLEIASYHSKKTKQQYENKQLKLCKATPILYCSTTFIV